MKNDEKIPVLQVLDDMYGDKGLISWAARDYYKAHYASPEEAQQMEREEKRQFIFAVLFVASIPVMLIVSAVVEVFS